MELIHCISLLDQQLAMGWPPKRPVELSSASQCTFQVNNISGNEPNHVQQLSLDCRQNASSSDASRMSVERLLNELIKSLVLYRDAKASEGATHQQLHGIATQPWSKQVKKGSGGLL